MLSINDTSSHTTELQNVKKQEVSNVVFFFFLSNKIELKIYFFID